ncbi:MAG: 3-keto-5-aminohexanoate cleavage protein [Deltaproteobacteria bacterium]|nr:3-keto-5-aminohexanoate cleavage protein [Deltaproteobacteria bacterium]
MESEKVVLTVSVTGSIGDRAANPALPVTPEEIAASAVEAGKAGAAVAHIHVRDVQTGKPSMEMGLYEETVRRIRDHSDILLNLTTGAGARFIPSENNPSHPGPGTTLSLPQKRIDHVLALRPEICSLDVGSMDFGPHIFINYLPHVEWMAERIGEAGVKPELECFDMGHVEKAKHLIRTGRIKSPPLFQLCTGIRWGIPATPEGMIAMKGLLPDDAVWTGFGIGATAFPMVALAAMLGGNVRIGFEDSLFIEKGKPAASNRQLVEKAVAILRLLGREPASPGEAKKLLKLER